MKTPAVVTGATGFLGSHLVARLLADGRRVTAAGRAPAGLRALGRLGAETVVWSAGATPPLLPPGCTVFHLAALRPGRGVRLERLEQVNVIATLELAERAGAGAVGRFVHVGSAVVFGPSTPSSTGPRREADGHAPVDSYGVSKARAAAGVLDLTRRGLPAVVVHPTIVFGLDRPHVPDGLDAPDGLDGGGRQNRVTHHLRRLLRHRLDVTIGDGRAARDLVHVADVVEGLLAAEQRGVIGKEYILGGEPTSHREFNQLALACAGLKARARLRLPPSTCRALARGLDRLFRLAPDCGYDARIQTLLARWSFDDGEARRELGYAPARLDARLRETVAEILPRPASTP